MTLRTLSSLSNPVNRCGMIKANRLLSAKVRYPLHLGVTEAGTPRRAHVKSTIGIGTLLMEGIGDTIRISITGDPAERGPDSKGVAPYSRLGGQSA